MVRFFSLPPCLRVSILCLLLPSTLHAAPIRCDITRDTWVSEVAKEADGNNGGAPRLKTKGIQEFSILDIDTKPLAGHVITSAALHLHNASPDIQRRLTVSTLATDWVEGTGRGYDVQKGSASFNWAAQNDRPWAWPGSDITAVMCGQGGTLWRFADASPPDKDGWQVVAVDPAVVAARVAGISYGFVLMDDVGSEYERNGDAFTYKLFPNRFLHSREEGKNRAPFMMVTLGPDDREAPDPPAQIAAETAQLPPGEALVSWLTPKDHGPAGTIGFVARYALGQSLDWDKATPLPQYMVPLAGAPGAKVTMHVRDLSLKPGAQFTLGIRAVDAVGNLSPVAKTTLTASALPALAPLGLAPVKPFDKPAPNPTIAGVSVAIIDALDKVSPTTGALIPPHEDAYTQANHIWSAATKTIRPHAARNEFVDFQIVLTGKAKDLSAQLTFNAGPAAPRPALHRFRYVNTKAGPLPDPLVPLAGPLSIPADDGPPDQRSAALIAEVYIPHDAKPGDHFGTLKLTAGGETLSLRVELHIWSFTLPDHLSFIPEMNCYGLPDPPAEVGYYRLAHAHRTCLNRLGYAWTGRVNHGCGPDLAAGEFKWDKYDQRFGPLLDGSAFADLPRKGVPVDTFYLPLNENWPLDVNKAFKGGYWADEAFEPAYRKSFVDACAKFAAHYRQKKWNDTFFEFYLNNKVYHKDKSWGRSSAPWIFDEPVNTQDFWALRYYGTAFHEGIALGRPATGPDVKMAFRCDVSRPQWQRDLLDGVLDVDVVGGEFRRYQSMVMDRKSRTGEITINYGSSNATEDSNVQPAGWCIDTWCVGADGVLPWQTVGTEKSWSEADQLSLFYPGGKIGSKDPIPSVRLKSYRRGQQDVEYLTMLTATTGQPRFAVVAAAREALKLSAAVKKTSADDAGLVTYNKLDPVALWELRVRVGAMLDAAKPPAKDRWVELRTPPRSGALGHSCPAVDGP